MKQGHIEKANDLDENCFVSPDVITVKKDKSVKIDWIHKNSTKLLSKEKRKCPTWRN